MNQPQNVPNVIENRTTSSVTSLLSDIDAQVPGYRQHAIQVRSLVERLLVHFPTIDACRKVTILDAALLHDVGKAQIPGPLLERAGPLTPAEMAVVRSHTDLGADLLETRHELTAEALLVRHHHEWWNGGGYPSGLSGESIPLGSRLIGIADSLDAMTSDRPYRTALSLTEAIAEIERCRGTQFDPHLVDLTLPMLLADLH